MSKLEQAGFETGLKDRITRSHAQLRFGDTQLKLRHAHPSNELAAQLCGNDWSFGYNFLTKDVDAEYRTQVKPGEFIIRQRIPKSHWELFPSPEFKLRTNLSNLGGFSQKLEVSYDLLQSKGRIEDTLESSRHKIRISADTISKGPGTLVSVRTKLNKDWAKTVGVDYSKILGPVLTYDAGPLKQGLTLKAAYSVKKEELWTYVEVAPSNSGCMKLHAAATTTRSTWQKPALRLGARYEV